jgi:hypothetical protein
MTTLDGPGSISFALLKFAEFHTMIERKTPHHKIITLRSNRGGEYLAGRFSEYLQRIGITRQLTTAYTPHQNSVAERKNCTILDKVRSMLIGRHVPKNLRTEAAQSIVRLINCSPTKANLEQTPEEKFYSVKPGLFSIRVFGCLSYAHIRKELRDKLES